MVMGKEGYNPESDSARQAREKLESLRSAKPVESDTEVFMAPSAEERQAIKALHRDTNEQSASSLARVEAIKAKLRGLPEKPLRPQETPNVDAETEAPIAEETAIEEVAETIEQPNEAFESWKITMSKDIRTMHDRVIRMTSALDSAKASELTGDERVALMQEAGIQDAVAEDFTMYQGDIARAIGREKNKLRALLDTYRDGLETGSVPEVDADLLEDRFERNEKSVVRVDFTNPELMEKVLAEQAGKEDYPPYVNLRNALNSGRPGRDWQYMGQDAKGNYLFIEPNQIVEYDQGESAKDHAIALSKKLVEQYATLL